MYDVAVYYSCLPRIADRDRKVQVMRAFAEGARHLGMNVCEQTVQSVVPARLSVIIGWYGKVFKGPHIHLRKAVIDNAISGADLPPNLIPIGPKILLICSSAKPDFFNLSQRFA